MAMKLDHNKHPYIALLFMIYNKKDPKYAYHISDIKGHNSAFTLLAMKDLMENLNDSTKHPLIYIKSDNCSQQYYCLHVLKLIWNFQNVFEAYLKLSNEIKKSIILYYSINWHGLGLVDAMPGLKSP